MYVRTSEKLGGPIRKTVEGLLMLFEELHALKETFKVDLRDQVQ